MSKAFEKIQIFFTVNKSVKKKVTISTTQLNFIVEYVLRNVDKFEMFRIIACEDVTVIKKVEMEKILEKIIRESKKRGVNKCRKNKVNEV